MNPPEDRRLRELSPIAPDSEERERRGREQMAVAAADPPAFERAMVEHLRDRVRNGRLRFPSAYMREFGLPKVVALGGYPDTRLAAIFCSGSEQGRWLGWSGAIWNPELFVWFGIEPAGQADIQEVALQENLEAIGYGPPPRFLPRRVTWYGYQPVSLAEAARFASFPLFAPADPPPDTERSLWITLGTVGGYRPEAVCMEWRGAQSYFTLVEGLVPDVWRARASWGPDPQGRELFVPTRNPFGPFCPMVARTTREGTLIWVDSSLELDAVAEILQSLERVPDA